MITIKDLLLDKLDCWSCRRVYWKLNNSYRSIRDYFFPRQRWLISKLKGGWHDKDWIIETCLFECLIHLVEGEKYFEYVLSHKTPDCPELQAKFGRELEQNYKRVKEELVELELKAEYEWSRIDKIKEKLGKNASYNEIYGNINEIEERIEKLKTEICLWAVANRKSFWT